MQTLGAIPVDDETVEFRVWAPRAASVMVRTRGDEHPLTRADDGTWSTRAKAGAAQALEQHAIAHAVARAKADYRNSAIK